MRVLVIKLGAVGDVIRTTSILPGLKSKFMNCKIDWITKKGSFDVLKGNDLISKTFIINNNAKNQLKNKRYDLVICLDDDQEACELASKISSKEIIGSYLKKNQKTYKSIIYGIIDLNYKKQEPILSLNKKELDFGKRFAKNHGIKNSDLVIGINTGAGGRWQDKKLSEEKTAKLIDSLNKQIKNIKIILFGGPEEAERNKEIKKIAKTNVIDAGCGNSLMEFASLVNLCKVLVTSDSLALHIGVALKKKIVVFFYVTSANEIELYGRGIKIIGKGKDCCSYKPRCYYTPKWDIGEIVDAVKKLI